MPSIDEVEKLAFDLPDSERAVLAAHLLDSLPSVFDDDDEGVAEALRRDAELNVNPQISISLEHLDELLPSVRSLPQPDKILLIQLLAADLLPASAPTVESLPTLASGDYPLWSPYGSHTAATALLTALDNDSRA